ncbi:MAG: KamA family radical SAM protein [Planctomycetota bacterium]|jgi:lysine 2,3-aminomutase
MNRSIFNAAGVKASAPMIFALAARERSLEVMRRRLCTLAEQMEFETFYDYGKFTEGSIIRVRDCARVFRTLLAKRSEDLAEFSTARAIRDIALDRPRPDLSTAFHADLLHIILGLQGYGPGKAPSDFDLEMSTLSGRDAAIERSRQLDNLWARAEKKIQTYPNGLDDEAIAYRKARKRKIMKALKANEEDWQDWKWQVRNVIRTGRKLGRLLTLTEEEQAAVLEATKRNVPFGITPYYLSLMHDEADHLDRAIRAQVIPPMEYVTQTAALRESCNTDLDFMREADTSPMDLITRRYPAIAIFKPYNTCPQICVYCQRNWEIDGVLDPGALAPPGKMDAALEWLRGHPAIHEILITGGDPLAMSDTRLRKMLRQIARIPTIERIRFGSRALVTMPMRITENLARILGRYREPGKREVVLVTHVQHPYEITPDTLRATERIRQQGIAIYNQLVYTFFISRRFEAAALRKVLRLAGISPYYTFNTKGKDETRAYRVPVARLLQEQKEDARVLPGMARSDEAVYNVPGMGKNYLRARQHRSMLAVLPNGQRVYEYHPWEKNISGTAPLETFITHDVPILEYLERLEAIGENVDEYQTIWYYF